MTGINGISSWVLECIPSGVSHRLRKGLTSVGRHSSSRMRILGTHYVSRHHAEIMVSSDNRSVTIKDLNSINGIYVNGDHHKSTTVTIQKGDKIGIGVDTNEIGNQDQLTLPIYELKYQPTTLKNEESSSLENQPQVKSSTSRTASSNATQIKSLPNLVIISDDDGDDNGKEKNGSQKNQRNEMPQSSTHNTHSDAILIKQEKGIEITTKPSINKHTDPAEIIISDDDSGDDQRNETHPPTHNNNPHHVVMKQEKAIETLNKNTTLPEITEEPTIHVPIIPSAKKELINTVTANVKTIFGDIQDDDDMTNKLKEMNPLVYKEITGITLLPVTNVGERLKDGDCITLSDDEELEDELGYIIPSTSFQNKNIMETTTRSYNDDTMEEDDLASVIPATSNFCSVNKSRIETSPNIFGSSLDESKEEYGNPPADNCENNTESTDNQKKPSEILHTSMDNVDLGAYISKVPDAEGDEDLEELMFSQALKMDMKAELQDDDFNGNFEEDFSSNDKRIQESHVEKNVSILSEIQNISWVISDDEDYDSELETKVTDWSSKIFSQSFNNMSMSQVYDLDPDNATDDEDEEQNNGMNEQCRTTEGDNIADLYNNNENECVLITDPEEGFENIKKVPWKVDEDEVIEIPEREYSKEIHKKANKTENYEKRFNLKNVTVVLKPPTKEILEAVKDTKEREKSAIKEPCQSTIPDTPVIRARKKSCSRSRKLASSSSSEDDDNNYVPNKAIVPADHSFIHTLGNANENSTNRQKPIIIDAPSLPKHKGKLRGVSAVKPLPVPVNHECTSKNVLKEKITSIRERITSDRLTKDLKSRSWTEKPSVSRKRDKEREKMIKETRKDKLKELAKKNNSPLKEAMKRKNIISPGSPEGRAKKAKVKLTTNNRGAFLANAEQPQTKPKIKENFKIPRISKTNANDKKKQTEKETETEKKKEQNDALDELKNTRTLKRCQSLDSTKRNEPLKCTNNIDASFSQQIAKPDELLLKNVSGDLQKQSRKTLIPKGPQSKPNAALLNINSKLSDAKPTMCKEAVAARALRTTNKITFASMENNLTATEACKEKLSTISSLRSTSNLAKVDTVRPKKTVRFNDVPIIHYIERIYGASRKIVGKDILPQTTYRDRRVMIRRNYPIIDNTNIIISQILRWSNEWLVKRDAAADAASETLFPMPNNFSSFEHYKSILFPLMKLEFASLLERDYKATASTEKYTVIMEYVTENKDRFILVTKFYFSNHQQLDSTKYDLVILESKQMNNSMFAYVTSVRKGAGSCNTMVFEVLPKNITKEFLFGIKELTVRPVIDNVRVEFGAYNAIYQLEATPLFQKILNPVELLHARHPAKKKPIYRGFDMLNEKQTQVLINTYSRIIDEATPNISLLQGPPGTGKSCVITNLALQTLYGDEVRYLDKKILICAQSNAAVDIIAEKLYDVSMRMRQEKRFRLIRYGLPEKINPRVYPVSLSHLIESERLKKLNPGNCNVQVENKENLKQQILQLEVEITGMLKRNVKGTVEEDMLLKKQEQLKLMRNIAGQLIRPEDERTLYTWYLSNANVVCATLSSCVKLSQYVNFFDICIIDEATQSTEPLTLLPLRFGITSLILVGDTQQLPATILSKKATDLGLGKSMFTRIQNCLDSVSSGTSTAALKPSSVIYGLQTQYRMHPLICKWPNQYFYRNELINGRITMEHNSPLLPFSVLNLAYTQNKHCSDGKITNNLEAEFVAKLLKALDHYIPNKCNSYGVITPYAQHRVTLEKSIRSLGLNNIMVNTIDSYQGLEKDVIVISNARTNGIGFLNNPQRLNVALTRPKKCLILCGNFKSVEGVPAWRSLLQSAKERNVYFEISTSCINDLQTNVIEKIKFKK